MKRIWLLGGGFLAVAAMLLLGFWFGAQGGWLGVERDAGVIRGPALPRPAVLARIEADARAAPDRASRQILFGDLHVHTTYSTDAFQWALPLNGGQGAHPVADACDFARYCSQLDFWAITDHAEASTPLRWTRTKDSLRQCQRIAGEGPDPDLITFAGFEWTQVGRLPQEHYGHKNVIFRDLDDAAIAARPIAAAGLPTNILRKQATGVPSIVPLRDLAHARDYFDFNWFIRNIQEVPDCDPALPSNQLSPNCFEEAATPGELMRRLDEQKLSPLIIPHGTSWGFYTPPGVTWDKALDAQQHPERLTLIEVYSGHGNSEEYRAWRDVLPNPDGVTAVCPAPSSTYTPSCWRAGEIIEQRCRDAGLGAGECTKRAAQARSDYANMGVAGHLAVTGETPEDWLDAGQCTDCFLPPFNHRPTTSVQAGLATTRFNPDGSVAARFTWGFIGSSDNHRARPGTGYKQVDRRRNTESAGPISPAWRRMVVRDNAPPEPVSKPIAREELMRVASFNLTEFERQSSFFLTGGLVAAHVDQRSRAGVWDALQRREVYATSGQRILLWFDHVDPRGRRLAMGGQTAQAGAPRFEVRAVGALKQKPGCPDFATKGLDGERIATLCSGECFNPSDERSLITRIEVVRIRPQARPGEPLDGLIQDPYLVHECDADRNGCSFSFSDPDFATGRRDTIYYVRAIQEPEPMINAKPIRCERGPDGACVRAKLCYGDYRSGSDECEAPAEPRAWSSPIYVAYGQAP